MSDKYNKEEPSVIQKIQNQTGCLLLVIGIAMLAFVLTDLLSSSNSIFGGNRASVGTIDGEDVDVQEYQQMVDGSLANFQAQNPGMTLSPEMRASLEQQAWNTIVQQKLVTREHAKLGLTVSPAELEDITIGDHPHARVIRSFTNPQTNQFDKAQLVQFLDNLDLDPEQKSQWVGFEQSLIEDVRAQKYATLIRKMFYGTELEARQALIRNELTVNAAVVGITYSSIPDSTVEVTDRDLRNYIRDNASKYEQGAQREIEYVVLEVNPSPEDSAETRNFIESSKEAFQKAEDDSLFVELKGTETPYDGAFKVRGNFTPDVEDALFSADSGTVLGPFESKGTFALFKIIEIGEDSLKSVRASHIVKRMTGFTVEDTTKALADANALIRDLRAGRKNFAEEAKANTDGSGNKGGDLGWLREDSRKVPKEFVEKAISTPEGGYFTVITRSGIHVGKVTSPKSNRSIKVARLTQTVTPSSETDRSAYRMAGQFMSKAKGDDVAFEEVADEMGLSTRIAKGITEKDRRVAGINNGNVIARWLFDPETDEGSISDIIEVDEKYVVAKCTRILEEGLPDIEDVRSEIEPLVMDQLKGEIIRKQVEEAYKNSNSADELASALETQVTPIPAVSFGSGSLPYVGFDNIVIGSVFGVPPGKNSGVVVGETGVYVIYVNNENEYELPSDIGVMQLEITNNYNQGVEAEVEEALLRLGEVKDQRYKYFD